MKLKSLLAIGGCAIVWFVLLSIIKSSAIFVEIEYMPALDFTFFILKPYGVLLAVTFLLVLLLVVISRLKKVKKNRFLLLRIACGMVIGGIAYYYADSCWSYLYSNCYLPFF